MVRRKIQKDKFSWLNFVGLTIAGIVNATGAILLLYPVKIYDSGISGLSMLIDQLTPQFLSVSIFLVLFNFPIFLFGLKKHGIIFTIYSLYAIAIYSLVAFIFRDVIFDLSTTSPIAGQEFILCALFGGAISGIGSGLTIRFGGAMDGLDVLAVTFAKKLGLTVGNFTLIFNTLLYIVAGITMSFKVDNSWILALYSIVAYFVGSKTVDYVVEGISRSISASIITNKAEEITKALSDNFNKSGTIVNAIGGYSKSEKQIIYFNVNHFQISKLRKLVYSIDKEAYVTLQDVSDIMKASKEK